MIKTGIVVDLLLYFILLLSSVSNAQEIAQHPMNTTVCEGSTATFICVVFFQSGIPTAPRWRRNGVLVDVDNMMRYTIVNNLTNADGPAYVSSTLTVSSIATSDDGIMYQCGASVAISNTGLLNVAGPPSEVSNITFNEVCTTSLIVSWNPSISNPVCNPLNYTVSLPFLVNQDPFITSDTNISLTGLVINENNNNLHVTIHSTNMAGNGNNLSSMTTLPNVADAIPGGVTNIRNTSFASNKADIAWDAANPSDYCGPVLYYTIFISNENINLEKNSTVLTTTIDGLMSNTTYNITIVAFNKIEGGMSNTTFITTAATGSSGPGGSSSGGLSAGAIVGIVFGVIIGIILVILIVIAVIYFLKRYNHDQKNGILSKSPNSSSPVETNEKKEPKAAKNKATKQKTKQKDNKQANKTEYAELQLSNTGTAPSVDPTKVDYTEVKEHEQLSYAQIQHEPGAANKPIQGAPPVEYKEVWHQ